MPVRKQTRKETPKDKEKILLKTENLFLKEVVKHEKSKNKSMWRSNTVSIMVLIGALLIMALGVLERNRLIATVGGFGFLMVIIKLLTTSIMEDMDK